MTDNRDELAPIFEAVITPHRSLPNAGFLILMIAIAVMSFIAGIFFLMLGAWPVFGFFGLDVLLIYWAFRINYARAAAYEIVRMTPTELRVRQVSHRGRVREWVLNPLWVTLEKLSHEEYGVERLWLVSRGKQLPIGNFLGPEEKASFANALNKALGEAKRGVTRTVLPLGQESGGYGLVARLASPYDNDRNHDRLEPGSKNHSGQGPA